MTSRVKELEDAYMAKADWEIHENANTVISYSDFLGYTMSKLLTDPSVLTDYLPEKAVELHFNRDIHIHKLPHSLWVPYCVGWSYAKLLRLGLVTPGIISKPAKHLSTAISHVVNFFHLTAQEWTGAQAISAMDLYAAPFVRHDGLGYQAVKQEIQKLFFELNYPTRLGYQSAFTNTTIMLEADEDLLAGEAIVGGREVGQLGDYLDEAVMVAKAFFDLSLEGDGRGQPFTFPIITIMLSPKFDWTGRRWGDLTDLIFTALARRGTAYILNGYSTGVGSLYAMCCRLTIDISKVSVHEAEVRAKEAAEEFKEKLCTGRHARGIWAMPDATGSIGVVTINLPRLAVLSKGEWDRLEELLANRLEAARSVLRAWRTRYERSLEKGLMPMTRLYLGHLLGHFSTIGLLGLPEMAANFMRDPGLWVDCDRRAVKEAISMMKRVVSTVRKAAEEFEEEDGCLYNVEEVPGESTAHRFALKDAQLFKDELARGEVFIPMEDGVPYYSNSIVPYYARVPLADRVRWEAEVQPEFTGGVMMHIFLDESPDPEALKKLVRRVAEGTKIVYFSITPTMAVCRRCGWQAVGLFEECPRCGGPVDLWSRIVGYYRPLRSWNVGKRAEFRQRVHYGNMSLRA